MLDIVQRFVLDPEMWRLVLVMAAPLAIAAIGEVIIEPSGILNVSIEGMMAVGAALGFLVTFATGSYAAGILAAMAGGGVLLVSSDLDELMSLCDRILVICRGRIAGDLPRSSPAPWSTPR